MTPTEMELRVATAIMSDFKNQLGGKDLPYGGGWSARHSHDPATWNTEGSSIDIVGLARSAIRAMREPTPEMTSPHVHGEMWSKSRLTTWQAMINAASPKTDGDK